MMIKFYNSFSDILIAGREVIAVLTLVGPGLALHPASLAQAPVLQHHHRPPPRSLVLPIANRVH